MHYYAKVLQITPARLFGKHATHFLASFSLFFWEATEMTQIEGEKKKSPAKRGGAIELRGQAADRGNSVDAK